MISAKAVYYNDKKTYSLAEIEPSHKPCAIQLFGSEPDIMAFAAEKMLVFSPIAIDINMGCPVGKIVSNHEGSALMKNIHLAENIVASVKKSIDIPVTVKFRLGFDKNNINCVEFAKALEQAGADAICVHGRTREQMYSGKANWDYIAKIKSSVKIPVFANGDVFTPEDCKNVLSVTSCDGVAIARGALGNPFIFKQIKEYLENGTYQEISTFERLDVALEHVKMLIADKGEYIGIREARKHLAWYTKGMLSSAQARAKINLSTSFNEIKNVIDEIKNNYI